MNPMSFTFSNVIAAHFDRPVSAMKQDLFTLIQNPEISGLGNVGIIRSFEKKIGIHCETKLAALTYWTGKDLQTILIRDRGRLSEGEIETCPLDKSCWDISEEDLAEFQEVHTWTTHTKADGVFKKLYLLHPCGEITPFTSIFPQDFQLPIGKIQRYLLWPPAQNTIEAQCIRTRLVQMHKRFDVTLHDSITLGVIQKSDVPYMYELNCYGYNPMKDAKSPIYFRLYLDMRHLTVSNSSKLLDKPVPLSSIANKNFYFILPSGNEMASSAQIVNQENVFKAVSTPALNFSEYVSQDFLFKGSREELFQHIEFQNFPHIQNLNQNSSKKITHIITFRRTSAWPLKYEIVVVKSDSFQLRTSPDDSPNYRGFYYPLNLSKQTITFSLDTIASLEEFLTNIEKNEGNVAVLKNNDELVGLTELLHPHDNAREVHKTLKETEPKLAVPLIHHLILDYLGDYGDDTNKLRRVTREFYEPSV